MVEESIVAIIQRYLAQLVSLGIHAHSAVLFGSYALGTASEHSDIDLVVIAPEFDASKDISLVKALWHAASVDTRIEPIPCGELEWQKEEGRPILDIARRDGILITR